VMMECGVWLSSCDRVLDYIITSKVIVKSMCRLEEPSYLFFTLSKLSRTHFVAWQDSEVVCQCPADLTAQKHREMLQGLQGTSALGVCAGVPQGRHAPQ
jgi:hypothetical protein